MAVKRVTESYAKGPPAGARREPKSAGARTPAAGVRAISTSAPPTNPQIASSKISENVVADIVSGLAELHGTSKPDGEIITSAEITPHTRSQSSKSATVDEAVAAIADDLARLAREPAAPAPKAASKVTSREGAAATIAVDLALQPSTTADQAFAPIDYHEIVASTVATLEHNTVEARHAVYECARQIVYQRLTGIRPPLTPDMIDGERATLEKAIDKIEAEALEKQPATAPAQSTAFSVAAPPIERVIVPAPRRNLPQAKHLHSGSLRLFAILGLLCAGAVAYWLIAGRPDIKSAVSYLPKLPGPAATEKTDDANQTAAAHAVNSDSQTSVASGADDSIAQNADSGGTASQAQATSGETDTDQAARALASNPLLNLKVDCNGAPCDPTFPTPMPSATSSDGAAWVASYGTVKSPTGLGGKPPTKEAAKLIEAGKAAAAPNAASSYERGMAKAKDGDSDGAIRDFSEAIRIDANFADAYVQRGNARFKNGTPDLAIADFQNAIQIDARHAAALKARGMARLYNADEEGALDDLSKAIQIAESEPARLPVIDVFFARRTRTSIYSRRRIGDRELFDLSAMIDAYWKNPDLAEALKVNYGMQGATSLMATIYRQRAALYVQRANTDGAIADLSFALQLDPARALQLVLERARVQDAAGRREQATADFKRVLQINPRVDEAKQAIARLDARQ